MGAKVTPTITIQPNTPESVPSTPTQVTLAKAPTPWLQNKNKPQEELPEWAKRSSNVARQQSSSSSSPDSPTSPPIYTPSIQQQTQQQQPPQAQQRPQQIQQPQLYQYQQQQQPQQFNQQQKRPFSSPSVTQQVNAPAQPQERVIPIRVSVYHIVGHECCSKVVNFTSLLATVTSLFSFQRLVVDQA